MSEKFSYSSSLQISRVIRMDSSHQRQSEVQVQKTALDEFALEPNKKKWLDRTPGKVNND